MKLLLLLSIIIQELFGVISITPVDIGDKPGYSGSTEFGLMTKRGNTDKDGYTGALLINYDNNSTYVIWLALSAEYATANGTKDTNKQYSHLRYINTLYKKHLDSELFLQAQEDEFKALSKRRLAGVGLRTKLFDKLIGGKGYAGLGGFYEYIRHTDSNIDPDEDNLRMNSYLAYKAKFNKDSKLALTAYYQPKFNDFSDYVIANKFELQIHIYLKIFLKFSIYYDYDSSPPNNVQKNYDLGQSTTFVYDF